MSTDPMELLDRLDKARAEASKWPWELVGGTHDRDVIDDHGCHVAATGMLPDAACIVAEHNAIPTLTAALRAVLAVADELEADAQRADDAEPVTTDDLLRMIAAARVSRHAAARIRSTIAAALVEEAR